MISVNSGGLKFFLLKVWELTGNEMKINDERGRFLVFEMSRNKKTKKKKDF